MVPAKATLEVVNGAQTGRDSKVEVHFNPQSLSVTYRTSGNPGTQNNSSNSGKQGVTLQQTGFTASLSNIELLFDTTQSGQNVQNATLKIAAMMQPQGIGTTLVPVVRFSWGTFLFIGTIQSMDETLDFFSEQGVPLRSTVRLNMSGVELDRTNPSSGLGFSFGASAGFSAGVSAGFSAGASASFSAAAGLSAEAAVGTTPLTLSQAGDPLQSLAGRAGVDASWKAIASANNIDNPRLMEPGTVLNLSARASVSAEVSS